ncbi:MAG: hypothetical protein FWF23_03640 [Alphaproteobacteria bacterium]|nr:hypothetical protein [Alphaproteobacteria bacterium]MCL2505847.1 hypothetical protein [Alphaproteobacteria bacterium]
MANEQNLKRASPSEARENGRKGGIARGKAYKEKRRMREILTVLLENPTSTGENLKESVAVALIERAKTGDVRAFETVMGYIGDCPTERMKVNTDKELEDNPFGL